MQNYPSILPTLALLFSITGWASARAESSNSSPAFTEQGKASFYADKFQNRKTANGERYKHELNTAAHRKLPFGSMVQVTNIKNGKSVIVRINDRGPFVRGRIIDLSKSAFESIGHTSSGLLQVKVEPVQ
ncbi:septal ring lytic transglycosylase RlpA family protein [Pseudomaricurvus sp. HS19]|uniref:septal ring lytic transglycosylase RlpA family protein n=1 Tax=Pseudomaricurvus sp. HS19 TaxID=2692626 RepID=UPI00136BA644|nr:septal ring lytic transglycosylase RlpA family protein [Pseudomaricurvus sp. HS19]MYM64885.1 septal ring lytic transglycosylase RlpA family protein [Pseudomaricurvus sp. HS19]